MSKLVDASQVTLKVGTYGLTKAVALADPLALQQVQAYRRQTGSRTMALDKYGSKKRIPESDYFVSRKIDGEFTVLVYEAGEAITLNPGGTVRIGAPFMTEAAAELEKAGVKQALICGELWVERPDGKRPRIHDVVRIARNPGSADEVGQLRFAVFDVMEVDGEPMPPRDYEKTWEWINKIFDKKGLVHPVETVRGGIKEICDCYEKWVEEDGSEGVVARSDETGFYKVKPRHNIDVVVIGFAEGVDDRAGMLHDLLLAVIRKDGSYHLMGRVGGGFTDQQRVDFLSDLRDLTCESEYAEVNSDHVAYEMVRPEWVIEISCLDLISQTTRGGSIDRMVLDWNKDRGEGGEWETVRRLPLVSVISPQFVRRREDKAPNTNDTRLAQLTDVVEIEKAEATAEDLQLPKSTIMKREVYTKVAKEKTMVRKLVMWKTNKEEASREFPAYVIHYTDFSPNRKDPLDREIRVSNDPEQIEALFAELKAGALKKGWVEVGA